jgi:hypothetical protein
MTDSAAEPRILRVLDASTANLSNESCRDLNSFEDVTAFETIYGWLLYVPAEIPDGPPEDDEDNEFAPADVIALWKYADRHDCQYILLDQDADPVPGLPLYTW